MQRNGLTISGRLAAYSRKVPYSDQRRYPDPAEPKFPFWDGHRQGAVTQKGFGPGPELMRHGGPHAIESALLLDPDLAGFLKNSTGSTSRTSASFPIISSPYR